MDLKKAAVIGLGHFGSNLSISLASEGVEVVAIDCDEDKVEALRDKVAYPVAMDAKDLRSLNSVGLADMDVVIVAIGEEFEDSILTVAHLQEMRVKRLVARVINPVHERVLRLMGVEEIILPEKESALRLAKKLSISGLLSSMEVSEDYSIFEVKVPEHFVGRSLKDVNLRNEFSLNLVTIKRTLIKEGLLLRKTETRTEVIGVPKADDVFKEGDRLVLFGKEKATRRLLTR